MRNHWQKTTIVIYIVVFANGTFEDCAAQVRRIPLLHSSAIVEGRDLDGSKHVRNEEIEICTFQLPAIMSAVQSNI